MVPERLGTVVARPQQGAHTEESTVTTTPSRFRRNIAALALVAAGVAGGCVLASTLAANAADSPATTATTTATAGSGTGSTVDGSRSQRSDEHLLTGSDADKATAAALAKYPGATTQRVETDSDGVFEAHLVTADGTRLIVQMDKDFAVTGTDSHAGGHGGHGRGANTPSGATPGGATPGATTTG